MCATWYHNPFRCYFTHIVQLSRHCKSDASVLCGYSGKVSLSGAGSGQHEFRDRNSCHIQAEKICNPKIWKNSDVNTFDEFDTRSLKLDARSSTCTVCPQFRRCTDGQRVAQKETGSRHPPRKAPRDQLKTEERKGISFLVPEQNAGQNMSIEWV
jgi:hypothetical protein